MGVNLRSLLPKTKVDLKSLSGKSIAIDAYNALYQFLAIIRQPDGTPLQDTTGRITSHLSGLLYRTANLVEMNVKVVYVFDGVPPTMKEIEIKRRSRVKKEALIKYERALKEGKMDQARTYAQMTSSLKDYMADDAKSLLTFMGIPWVQAPSEGEAQASYLAIKGETNFCGSQDYDSLLFGAPRLIRNVTITGRRKLPRKPVYIEVVPEIVELRQVLKQLEITREQLVDIGILIGTDFNPEGIKGIGPKTALKLIKQHGTLEKAVSSLKDVEFPVNPQKIREVFLEPKVTDNYELAWKKPNVEQVVNFLCRERDFSDERVYKALNRMIRSYKEKPVTLEKWFSN